MTGLELVKAALRKIEAIASGETPTTAEQNDAKSTFNSMIDSWMADGLLVPSVGSAEYTLTADKQSYTIGASGADLTATRPAKVIGATIKDGETEYPVDVVGYDVWRQTVKSGSGVPSKLYYQKSIPNGTIYLADKPSSAHKLVLYTWTPLSAISDLTLALSLPPTYERALILGLAIELAPEYGDNAVARGQQLYPLLLEAKATIRQLNYEPLEMACDAALTEPQIPSIYSGV